MDRERDITFRPIFWINMNSAKTRQYNFLILNVDLKNKHNCKGTATVDAYIIYRNYIQQKAQTYIRFKREILAHITPRPGGVLKFITYKNYYLMNSSGWKKQHEHHFCRQRHMARFTIPKENNDGHKGVVLHSPTVGRRYYPTDCFVIWQTIFLNEQNYFFWLEMSLESAQVTFS